MSVQTFLKYLVRVLLVALACFILWYFSTVFGYIAVSLVLLLICKPLKKCIDRIHIGKHQMPSALSAVFCLIVIWTIILAISFAVIPLLLQKISQIGNLDLHATFYNISAPFQSFAKSCSMLFTNGEQNINMHDILLDFAKEFLDLSKMETALANIVNLGFESLMFVFSVSFITFFFLKDSGIVRTIFFAIFPEKNRENVINALETTSRLLSRYFTGILVEALMIAVVLLTCLTIFGMPLSDAAFIAFTMGLMNIIPYAGPLIGSILAVFIGLISPIPCYGVNGTIILTIAIVLVVKGIDDFILQPVIYSGRVNAHPLEVFIVILFAATLGGIIGMLLAVPLYTVLRVFLYEFFPENHLVKSIAGSIR